MSVPIQIFKNNQTLFKATNIQQAARFLADHLNISIYKCYDPIERGYVYHIPYYVDGNVYRFVAPKEIAEKRRKELEERNHKNARRIWLVPANPEEYDIETAFTRYDTLEWRRSFKYENGDILFLYVSGKVRRVMYKVEVIEGLVSDSSISYDENLWVNKEKISQLKDYQWSRVRLVDSVDTPELSLEQLRKHGLKGNIQGSMKLKGELRDYIMQFFNGNPANTDYPDEVPEDLEEGKKKAVTVNVYERNPIARKKCIEHYGIECQVCEIDFQQVYGAVGENFIHVHHIIPLHEIKQDYIVDPIKDLIPVCPNCHAMLHRKENGKYLTIEQLRERIAVYKKSV